MRSTTFCRTVMLILVSLGLTSCAGGPDAAQIARPASGGVEAATISIQVAKVIGQILELRTQLPAEMSAYQDVALFPRVQGFVDRIDVDRGSKVRKGQVLVQMGAPELAAHREESMARARAAQSQTAEAAARLQSIKAQLLEAEARMMSDETTYARLKAASATPGVVAGNDLDFALRALEASRARVAAAMENQRAASAQLQAVSENEKAAREAARSSEDIESYLRILAPFDGIITDRNIHQGSFVGPAGTGGQPPPLRIQQVSQLRLVVSVPEVDIAGIEPGKEVTFTVPAFPGESFKGVIRRVSHALDARTRTMPVELEVSNPSGRLAPGMYADVLWSSKRLQRSLFVPPSAVAVTTERIFVIRIKDGGTEWVDVKRGAAMGGLIEVFGNLSEGDFVALRGTDELRPGTKVLVKPQH